MTLPAKLKTVDEFEHEIGNQVRRLRFRAGLDQEQLAEQASVSRGAIKNLEAGRGSTLATVIKVLRALERAEWLLTLSPTTLISPMQTLRNQRLTAPRKKVYRPRGAKANTASKDR